MKTDHNPTEGNIVPPPTAEPVESPPAKVRAVYRKSVLRRLGVLRSVAGSDPWLDALP